MTASRAPLDDPRDHLALQLERLDLLIHREILRLRALDQLSTDDMRGLYISDAQVDALVDRARAGADGRPDVSELSARAERSRPARTAGAGLPWSRLARQMELSPVEEDLLLIAVALDVDPKYETLYAYLNDHISRRWPTIGLALSLVAPTRAARAAHQHLLYPDARLFRSGLLRALPAPADRASALALGFRAAPAVVRLVVGQPLGAPAGTAFVGEDEHDGDDDPVPADLRAELGRMGRAIAERGQRPLIVLEGLAGAGRTAAARRLAAAAGTTLLAVDARAPAGREAIAGEDLALHARLTPTALLVTHAHALLDAEGRVSPEARSIGAALTAFAGPVLLAVEPASSWRELGIDRPHAVVTVPIPEIDERAQLWRRGLRGAGLEAAAVAIAGVADRFALTARQIRAATDELALRHPAASAPDEAALFAAARAQCTHRMDSLATAVPCAYAWEDLVLPPAILQRLREVVGAVAHRRVVYGDWGFGRGGGQGLKVMFAGPSGTGKTMSAGVMARALGLDLFRIDLSAVVSKYIGETEKNLARIFRGAADANAVLFFDEADALFGKRSEVKDAHDRYANIEVAYLLQRIEAYDGLVILATNLSRNIDPAFSRRLQEVVEFPMPDETQRDRLWRAMLGPQVPLAPDADVAFLAKHFPISGGEIRNVALEAAFLAAQDGAVVTMEKLVRAMAHQVMKQGRIPSAAEFKQYHRMIGGDEQGGSVR
jgi:AAA+ superfamily predicted ATPase